MCLTETVGFLQQVHCWEITDDEGFVKSRCRGSSGGDGRRGLSAVLTWQSEMNLQGHAGILEDAEILGLCGEAHSRVLSA